MPKALSVGVRISPALKESLQKKADADARSLSSLIAKILAEWDKLTEKPGGSDDV